MIIHYSREEDYETKQKFNYIYNKYYRMVWVKICQSNLDESLYDDVLQETFVKFFLSIGKLQSEKAIVKWLNKVTESMIIDFYRKAKTYKKYFSVDINKDDVIENGKLLAEKWYIDDLMKDEISEELVIELNKLNPNLYESIVMRYVIEFTVEEIAIKLRIPVNTVYSRLKKAKYLLRNSIEKLKENKYKHGGDLSEEVKK